MNKLLNLISLNIDFIDHVSYRRVLIINSILIVTTFAFLSFSFISIFLIQDYNIAVLDFVAALISITSLIILKKNHNIANAAKLATFNLFLFSLTFIYINGNDHFSLIWTISLPIFATFANGKRIGLIISLLFYALLFSLAFVNIGVWSHGEWILLDWMRLVAASLMLTFAMYMNEQALEESDKKLELVRKQEKDLLRVLHSKSITDELTKLYNRRYFYDMIPKLTTLAKRKRQYITFFILDIDYFKNYNDYYGHANGDKVLVEIAQVIKNHIQRDDDFVFRLGGEEFAGIVISDDKEKTHEWIKKLCPLIEKQEIEHIESYASDFITASVGIATVSPSQKYDIDKLYNFADQALYCAKNNGRNRSELSYLCT